jgi:hypothetical protein
MPIDDYMTAAGVSRLYLTTQGDPIDRQCPLLYPNFFDPHFFGSLRIAVRVLIIETMNTEFCIPC